LKFKKYANTQKSELIDYPTRFFIVLREEKIFSEKVDKRVSACYYVFGTQTYTITNEELL